MTEQTPGPWKSGHHATIAGRFAIRHESGGVTVGHSWNETDARLMAAAPELLEALKEAIELVEIFHGPAAWDIYESTAPEMQRLKAAIAKAEDRS